MCTQVSTPPFHTLHTSVLGDHQMTISTTLPPSARDFQIYQRLLLDGASTRQTAADFSLSQTRIRQISQHVAHWLAQSLPPSCEATDAAYLRLALHIASDRLQLIYGEAMHGWRATHESKYAGIILRVTAAMGKMPVTSGALDALLADALEGPLPEEESDRVPVGEHSSTTADPPPRATESTVPLPSTPHSALRTPHSSPPPSWDCSPAPISAPPPAQPTTPSPTVTPSPPIPSNTVPRTTSAHRRAFLAPAHSLNNNGNDDEITELKVTPQTHGFTTKKQLSRRDRRRLRRLAATK